MTGMDALLWILPVVALVVGVYFLVRAFLRLQAAMRDVKAGLAELNEMAPRLQRLAGDMSQLSESIEERRRQ
jgi:cytochrome c-type biogenesis protein CcmH/NrfF